MRVFSLHIYAIVATVFSVLVIAVLPSQCNKQHSSFSKNQQYMWVMNRLPLPFWCGAFLILFAFERSVCKIKHNLNIFIDLKTGNISF